MPRIWFALIGLCCASASYGEELDYHVTDPDLKIIRLDSSPDDSFLSVRVDTEGRIFVGGRKTLFAYDVDEAGRYRPRKLLFEFPDHTWVNDIEIRGDDLYIVTVSAVYRLPGARVKREGLNIERLLWGVPNGHVHQCFHACAWGPEGDLYVSLGDPLWYYGDFERPDHWGHWTMFFNSSPVAPRQESRALPSSDSSKTPVQTTTSNSHGLTRIGDKEWATMPYNGVGGVFRIRPDGTNLRSYSRGLRNPCGLCFDKNWNLFTNDNDHEGIPALYAPGRLLHVTEGSYFSWPRGWLQSKTPDRADILPAVNDQMGRAVPVLQTYYADGYLPPKYENSLVVARWCRRQVTYFPLEPKGDTFTAKEHVLLEGRDQARPVGVCVGRGGRLFVTICYMAQNEGSPTYRSDLAVITRKDDLDTMPFDGYDVTQVKPVRLWKEIANKSWWRRGIAHQELLRRGGQTLDMATSRLLAILQNGIADNVETRHLLHLAVHREFERGIQTDPSENDPTLAHTQLLRDWSPTEELMKLVSERSPVIREQLIRKASFFDPNYRYISLKTPEMDAISQLTGQASVDDLAAALRSPFDIHDSRARNSAAMRISHTSNAAAIVAPLLKNAELASRFTGLLAAGFRLTIPPVAATLAENAPLAPQQKEEANIILFADEKEPIDLRKFGRVGNYTVAEHWKALKHTDEQEQLFALLLERLDDDDDKIRLQAAHFLSLLNDPRSEPKIALVTANVQDKRLNLGKLEHLKPVVWMLGPVPDADGFKTVHAVETTAIDLSAKYEIGGKSFEWKLTKITSPDRPLYDFHTLFGSSPNSSVYSFFRFDTPTAQRMQLLVGSEDGAKIWQNGKLVFENDVVRPLIQLDDVVTLDLQPGSNDILVRVRMRQGLGGQYFHFRHLGDVKLTIPDKPDGLSLAERLKSAGTGSVPVDPKFLAVDWVEAINAGDAERGRKLFAAESLGCAKCHAATSKEAGGGGPSLTDAGKRFTVPYLVESVLAPNKVISPVFKSTIIQTTDGKVITGLVVAESADKVEVLQPDTKRISVLVKDIEARKLTDISAMPQGIVKTPEELRDVLVYLLGNP